MNLPLIITITAIILALVFIRKKTNLTLWLLEIGLVLVLLMGLSGQAYMQDSAHFAIGLLAIGFTFYTINQKLWLALPVGVAVCISVASDFFFFSYAATLKWVLILPVVLLLVIFFSTGAYRKIHSTSVLLTAFALIELLSLV